MHSSPVFAKKKKNNFRSYGELFALGGGFALCHREAFRIKGAGFFKKKSTLVAERRASRSAERRSNVEES
jgi:hypothetical protein